MQKLNEIQRYKLVKEGQAVKFEHPEGQELVSRLIKMRLNVPQSVNLYVTRLDKVEAETGEIVEEDVHFLAHCGPGFEQLEYYYRGNFTLSALGGDIWLDTLDSSDWSLEATDDTNYARLWEREERDPRILEMEQMARYNRRLLEEQMAADRAIYEARMSEMRAMMEKVNVSAPAADGTGGTPSAKPVLPSGASGDDKGKQAPADAGTGGEPDA